MFLGFDDITDKMIESMVLLQSFSSLTLSRTMRKEYTIIHTFDDLLERDDILPFIYMSEVDIRKIEANGEPNEKAIIRKSKSNNDFETDTQLLNLAKNALIVKSKIRTHCIIGDLHTLTLLKGDDPNLFFGSEVNTNRYSSLYFSRHIDNILFDTTERIMYDITEKGLRAKWTSVALEFGWKFYQVPNGNEDRNDHRICHLDVRPDRKGKETENCRLNDLNHCERVDQFLWAPAYSNILSTKELPRSEAMAQ
ncbi:unnamed protein product [Oppiella nova]|uniref:Uncharacterized protein n=1 Tax=Oppiella nova TaxID=334625 RepID=A0A7R9LTN6_9ACAR|nr:unnamed protein product [Oppiella nova]CAG2166833.1 unnamed protein product [Oppiella nova]